MNKKHFSLAMGIALVFYFGLFFVQKINLTTADLGRHIINGQVFLSEGKIVSNNFYSYTESDFPTVTHHWLSGVVFYLVESAVGFQGLSWFYLIISGLTVYLFFKNAKERSDLHTALFFTFLVLPLIADRKEIRPEGFSYLLLGLYYYLLTLFEKKKISFKFVLPLLAISQLLWVNLHIFFVMGIFIVGVFAGKKFIDKYFLKKENNFYRWLILLTVTVIVSLINPYGLKGLLEPFSILKEYGYMIIENQTVFFMQKRAPNFKYFYLEVLAIISLLLTIHILIKKQWRSYFTPMILMLVFLVLAFRAIRGIPIFALFFVPFAAQYFYYKDFKEHTPKLSILTMALFIFTLIPGHYFSFYKPGFGFGLLPQINASANFYQNNNLEGPVFNNYDIGGYLIYHLYGDEKVFVDNRPEAYSVEFFEKTYVPMQEKEEVWQQKQDEYDFNVIYFYRHDATPWAQPFLIERIKDPEWVPIFVDNYVLILIRNSEKNQGIIKSHALPQEKFVARPS